jgi:uncharacterized protein YraI
MNIREQLLAGTMAISLATFAHLAPLHAEILQVVDIPDGVSLNVRSGPSANAQDIGDLQEGDFVDVKGYNLEGTWAQFRYRGQIAWISAKYLASSPRPDGASIATGPHQVTGIKAGDPDGGLVVRSAADAGSERLGVLPNGAQIHVVQVSEDGKWAHIPFGSVMAWVSRRYLNAIDEDATSVGTPQPIPAVGPMTVPDGLPLPAIFSVHNVPANDSLNIRNAPQTSGTVLMQAQNGIALAVLGMATATWAKVQIGDVIGFAHADYLTRGGGTTNMFGFQLGVECIGTEPFWRITFDTDNMVRMTMVGEVAAPVPLTSTAFSPTATGYPYVFDATPYSGEVNLEICSDGMSDNTYPMSIQLTTPNSQGAAMAVQGCCRLQ